MNNNKLNSVHLIPLSFLGAILIGTLFLILPVSSAAGQWTPPIDALFTATTSVCVTGLVVVDTYSHWSLFGQAVILVLIQIGGLGVITVVSTLMLIAHKRFSLSARLMLRDAMNLDSLEGLLSFLARVIRGTLIVELAGALLYMIAFIPRFGIARGIWASVFNAISAFCNAGMDILGPDSLMSYRSDPLVLAVTMTLIAMGGLGYVVWFDITGKITGGPPKPRDKAAAGGIDDFDLSATDLPVPEPKKPILERLSFKNLTEHTKLVLNLTVGLILAGTVFVFLAEFNNPETLGAMSMPMKILNSMFESVTFRTAGFASIPQGGLREVSCIAGCFLMFIGGSPIGTAGGVKTTTFYFYFLNITSYIKGQNSANVCKHSVSPDRMMKATAIVEVSMGTVLLFTMLLVATNPVGLTDGLFEVMSACATVGLTRGLTPLLNTAGKLIIIVAMYLGRIGPISMALFFTGGRIEEMKVHYPDGNFFIG